MTGGRMTLDRALAIVQTVVSQSPGAVSVLVADDHGELVAAATMDGAAPDTRLNAQRKAYTAARSDARTTRELAAKVSEDAVERASFDPFFTFFLGGVAVYEGSVCIGAVGVSGLSGDVDEQLALQAIELSAHA
jgi:glc operon protein GlcG